MNQFILKINYVVNYTLIVFRKCKNVFQVTVININTKSISKNNL